MFAQYSGDIVNTVVIKPGRASPLVPNTPLLALEAFLRLDTPHSFRGHFLGPKLI